MCRAPVLSVVECPLLEQLLDVKQQSQTATASSGASAEASSSSSGSAVVRSADAARAQLKEGLRDLSQGDLNLIPGDYRAHLVRQAALRAIRKGDLSMLESCMNKFKGRASTRLFCDAAALWKKDPQPVIAVLLSRGARLNGHCEDAPLLHAVHHGNLPMVKGLLEQKANPSRSCVDGETALHVAVRRGRLEHVEVLLQKGAPADVPDGFERTPLDLANMGEQMHLSYCGFRDCSRCEARRKVREAIEARLAQLTQPTQTRAPATRASTRSRTPRSEAASVPDDVPRPSVPDVVPIDTANGADDESEDSSSNWEESESDVSDIDHDEDDFDMEGEEEECEGEEEEETDGEDNPDIDFNDLLWRDADPQAAARGHGRRWS